ncbi:MULTISPECIES: glycosyltransferase family 2 protein [Chelativorans]|uniref:Glycosyl transferase, family 2 n=1 Tax=Chelativorans sp. (strain BNC1) TaxID=266779 RepID=Q11C09_CHESB|nr:MULTISPECIES: glycosyltransferase family 2 protein [Chelativorans]
MHSTLPLVSVVMPARNAAPFIMDAISSVCAQTYLAWELIVIDDCSDDETAQIVEEVSKAEPRIRQLTNYRRLGAAASRNRALDLAQGSYIAFLDSDDFWHPMKLDRQLQFIKASGTAITFGDYIRMRPDGQPIGSVRAPESTDYHRMLRSNFIGNLTAVYKKSRLQDLRFENVGAEDYLFWLQALQRLGEPVFATPSDVPLANYRVNSASLSGNKFRSAKWPWIIYTQHLGYSKLKSCYYMTNYIYHGLRKRCHAV